jgi:Zn-dependent peptidase ImmA (M78 family)
LLILFAEHLIARRISLTPEAMAKEFTSFFSMYDLPTMHYAIKAFGHTIGVDIEYSAFPENIRGSHYSLADKEITIMLDESGYAGRIHTLYHEIYEIICELINKPKLKTEYKANLFAASVIMPEDDFFEYVIRRDLMMCEIKEYNPEIATDSILLRINYFLKKRGVFHAAFLLKNSTVYRYASVEDYRYLAGYQHCLSTLDLSFSDNTEFARNIISESCKRIQKTPSDELSLIRFSRSGCIVLAEPILFDWSSEIKEIAIQVIYDDTYNNLRDLIGGKRECSRICESFI